MKKRDLLRPTKALTALLFVLAAMWYAASSQNSAAGYLLLFALTSVLLVSIPHTLLNLSGLTATPESVKPTFAGQEVSVPIEITNGARAPRRGIKVTLPNYEGEAVDEIPSGKAARVTLRFPAMKRGEHEIDSVYLKTAYPLGFLRAAKRFVVSRRYLVYPEPAGDPHLPPGRRQPGQARPQAKLGEGDDFAGVRSYIPGESQRHIDWKAVARGQALMTKQFTAEFDSGLLYLDFAQVHSRNVEESLSQLTLWVIEAERARRPYGLRLPNIQIAPSLGEAHFHQCLRALTLFSS